MGSDCDKFDDSITPRSSITMLQYIAYVVKKVVPNALHDALGTLNESKEKVEHYISSVIPSGLLDSNTAKSQKKSESTGTEPSNAADQKSSSDLLNSTSEIRAAFSEASHSLDLFDNYLKSPSEETAKPLKLLFDRGKDAYNDLFTADNIDRVLDVLRSFIINKCPQDDNNESEEFDHDSSNTGNGKLENDVDSHSEPHSGSKEAFQLHLQKEKLSPLSPKIQTIKMKFESMNICENEHYDQVASSVAQSNGTRNPGNEPDIFHDNLMQSSQIPKTTLEQEHGKIPTTKGDSQIHGKKAFKFMQQPNLRKRIKELKDKNLSLRKQLESLQIKFHQSEETLSELGKITVEETAKRNEERKSETFHRIFRSPLSEAKRSLVSTCNDRPINDHQKSSHVNGSLTTKTTSANPPLLNASLVYSAASSEQSANGAEALVEGDKHQTGKEIKMRSSGEDKCEFRGEKRKGSVLSTFSSNSENPTPTTQNSLIITSTEKTNGGEGSNQSGDVKATSNLATTSRQSYDDLSFSIQQHDSGMESISLANIPPTSVATTLYNNYKLLLLSFAQRLLSSEVVMLKDWAAQNFSIVNPQNATDLLFQLDEKRVINASDLSKLCDFFESIIRFDLVYIVDAFLLGDYGLLRQTPASKNRNTNGAQNPRHRSTSRNANPGQFSIYPAANSILQTSEYRNSASSRKPGNSGGAQNIVPRQTQQATFLNLSDTSNPKPFSRFTNENQAMIPEQPNLKPITTGFTPLGSADVVAADGPVTSERRTTAANSYSGTNPSTTNNASSQSVGSNGSRLSKFQRSDTERTNGSNLQSRGRPRDQNLDRDDNWLCSHYKRHCYVKFECCDNFWPCHRCHNNQSTCGQKKLKSRDTKMLKCVYCNKVQQFGEYCCDCGAKFSDYYCGLCKHLTGNDDHPYHCEKCGICRIHGDRSFHCDVCGVCLDVQLRGNHKCREGSAHDECCICLEDAFTGCQILPCSHKVHKECATQMIRSGITRCPICRESFAHKLERRPLPNSRKRAGK